MLLLEYFYILIIGIQIAYYFFIFSRFSFASVKKNNSKEISISVIICANNEAANLTEFLPSIYSQKYKYFEVVLVNDHSTDDTLQVMQSFAAMHSNTQIVNLSKNTSGNKKNAVTNGIKTAKYEHLLFTDADCKPASEKWISKMSEHFSKEKQLIIGYGAYEKINNSFLNKLIRFETLQTAIQYFSYAKNGLAYMAVGRNMAYTKSEFNSVNGFTKHQHIKSGDDDLLVNQIATTTNVSCCYSKDSFTISKVHHNFKKWFYQKRRHVSTATSYQFLHQFLLGLYYITQFSFWLLTFVLLWTVQWKIALLLFAIRIGFQYLIYGLSAKKLKETDLIIFIPFLELFLIIIQMCIFITNLISKPKNW